MMMPTFQYAYAFLHRSSQPIRQAEASHKSTSTLGH